MKASYEWSRLVLLPAFAIWLLVGVESAESQTCVLPPSGLVAWWPGDNSGEDIVGGNDVTLQGNSTFATGFVGNAFDFGDTADIASSGANVGISGTQPRTIDAWVQARSFTSMTNFIQPAVGWGSCATKNLSVLGLRNQGFFFWGHGADLQGSPKSLNQWYHVAMTYDGTVKSLYVNGVLEASTSLPALNTVDTPVTLGGDVGFCGGSTVGFDGLVDEVEIFDRALSQVEIQAIYDAGSAGKCKPDVQIDIKPGSDPNSINPKSNGKIPVAILSTNTGDGDPIDFDATQVDPLSVEFGQGGATEAHGRGHVQDVDGDGDMDLILHFKTKQTGISCGDVEVLLTGMTFSGDAIEGTDSINTVGCQ